MTYEIVQTMPSATKENDTAAIQYFWDTFLPARGWTTAQHPTKTDTSSIFYKLIQRNFTDLFTNTPAKSYLWAIFSLSSSSVEYTCYEDSTYTTVPGDLANDTTNYSRVTWTINSGSAQYPWKFWVSTENNKAFLVTRNEDIYFWDPGIDWPVYTTWPGKESPGTDRYSTCIMQFVKGYAYSCNLPVYTGTSSSESYVITYLPPRYSGLEGAYLTQPISIAYKTSSSNTFYWDQADVMMYVPSVGNRSYDSTYAVTMSGMISKLQVVQFNGTGNYWLMSKDSASNHSFAFNVGPTVPDLIGD